MQNLIKNGIFRILNQFHNTIGTGFIVSDKLGVTCMHVIEYAGSKPGETILVRFPNENFKRYAKVDEDCFSPIAIDDIAFLIFDSLPEEVVILPLGKASNCNNHHYSSHGFPKNISGNSPSDERICTGVIEGIVSANDGKSDLLQITGEAMDYGMSGAPILDLVTQKVIGLVSQHQNLQYRKLIYAITTDTLIKYYPSLLFCGSSFAPYPYILTRVKKIFDRANEIHLINQFFQAQPKTKVCIIHNPLGGMGKSALAWKWFNEQANVFDYEGRMWWSFEHTTEFRDFLTQAVSYFSQISLSEISTYSLSDLRICLQDQLNNSHNLLVLDGIEKLFQMPLPNNQKKGNIYLSNEHSEIREYNSFLMSLLYQNKSQILITSRQVPQIWKLVTGDLLPGCQMIELSGFSPDDARILWRDIENQVPLQKLTSILATINYFPLYVIHLAAEVRNYITKFNRKIDELDNWLDNYLYQGRNGMSFEQVLYTNLLENLDLVSTRIITTVTLLRYPVSNETLYNLVVAGNQEIKEDFYMAVEELVDKREIIGRIYSDNQALYDIHPVVKHMILAIINEDTKVFTLERIKTYFKEKIKIAKQPDLKWVVELYRSLVELKQFDDAWSFFDRFLINGIYREQNDIQLVLELLHMLLDEQNHPKISEPNQLVSLLDILGHSLYLTGNVTLSLNYYHQAVETFEHIENKSFINDPKLHCAAAYRYLGKFDVSQGLERKALLEAEDQFISSKNPEIRCNGLLKIALAARYLGITLCYLGIKEESLKRFNQSIEAFQQLGDKEHAVAGGYTYLAEWGALNQEPEKAVEFAKIALEKTKLFGRKSIHDHIRAYRTFGKAILIGNMTSEYQHAEEFLLKAIEFASQEFFIEEQIASITWYSELLRQQKKYEESRKNIILLKEYTSRGDYLLLEIDALIVEAQLENDLGNKEKANLLANEITEKAEFNGFPYAFGIREGKRLLATLL
jgi:hypothetical protein